MRATQLPVGVAVLRNDAEGALAVAAGARFVRVNVLVGTARAAQGVLTGRSHAVHRLRRQLGADVAIFADAHVKHSRPVAYPELAEEVRDLAVQSDAVIVSGELTGVEASPHDLVAARSATPGPVLVGSGVTAGSLSRLHGLADGFIVGSDLKHGGLAHAPVDPVRVATFMQAARALRAAPALAR